MKYEMLELGGGQAYDCSADCIFRVVTTKSAAHA
jgi:hypothetical protein